MNKNMIGCHGISETLGKAEEVEEMGEMGGSLEPGPAEVAGPLAL